MNWLTIDAGPAENLNRGRGIGAFVRSLALSLEDAGVDPGVSYLSCRPVECTSSRWAIRSRAALLTGVSGKIPDRVAALCQFVDAAQFLPRDVRRTGAAVFLATDPNAIAISLRFLTVAMAYDFIPLIFPQQYLHGVRGVFWRARFADSVRRLRKATASIAISDCTRRDAVRLLGLARSKIDVVPLGVDHGVFHPHASTDLASVTNGEPYLLYVGETDARKNVGALIGAFRELSVDGLHLVLAGGSERSVERLRARYPETGDASIHLLGPVDVKTLAGLYAGATAFVFPSLYEGFGLPVLEAMACGAPVICSPVSAMQEVAGDAALFADPDPAALARAIERVASDATLRADLRGRGLERAASFTWASTRDGILDACRRAVRTSGSHHD